ncbi:dolabradiene monooxygenase-like [Miscanthus floridulus]|uniref:dolabradiene monooxygenase-like n=1 Tax=Miscanthus floridulus TaxID=154761 RepID=UPI00345AFFE1
MKDYNVMVLEVGVAMLLIVVVSKLRSLLVTKNKKSKLNLPPGPWTLPLIGSVHHLVSNPVIHRGLGDLSRKHGPLMMLRLGEVPTLVVSSAEEVTKTHDSAFADRHVNATLRRSPSTPRTSPRPRGGGGARLVGSLAASASASAGAGAAVDLTKIISRLINDTCVRESIGSRYEYLDAFDTAIQQTSALTVADLFPSSRLMQMLGTAPRKALACRNRITRILDEIIREKWEAMDRGDKTAAHDGLLGVLLRL